MDKQEAIRFFNSQRTINVCRLRIFGLDTNRGCVFKQSNRIRLCYDIFENEKYK